MQVGDLVIHAGTVAGSRVGIITHLWVGGGTLCHRKLGASVLFEDGEYDVDSDDLEVINESR